MISFQKNQVFLEQIPDFSFIKDYTKSDKHLLGTLTGCFNHLDIVYPSKKTLGDKSGLSERTATRAVAKFVRDGLITKRRRYNNSNVYEQNPLLYDTTLRLRLSDDIPAFKYFPFKQLMFSDRKWPSNNMKSIYIQEKPNFSWGQFWHGYRRNEFKQFAAPSQTKTTTFLTTKQQHETLPPTKPPHVLKEMQRSDPVVFVKKKREAMTIIPDYIHDIHELDLTYTNKIQLSVYSHEVIDYARTFLKKQQHVTNPIAWFIGVCKKYNNKLLTNMTPVQEPKQVTASAIWQGHGNYDREAFLRLKAQDAARNIQHIKLPLSQQYYQELINTYIDDNTSSRLELDAAEDQPW